MQKAVMSFLIFPHIYSSAQKKIFIRETKTDCTSTVKSSPQGTQGESLSLTKSPKPYARY